MLEEQIAVILCFLAKSYWSQIVIVILLFTFYQVKTYWLFDFWGIRIDDYIGVWKRAESGSDHACHKINETQIECKSDKIKPQILTVNNSNITWEFSDHKGSVTIMNGAYIGRDLMEIKNMFWVKIGTPDFFIF